MVVVVVVVKYSPAHAHAHARARACTPRALINGCLQLLEILILLGERLGPEPGKAAAGRRPR